MKNRTKSLKEITGIGISIFIFCMLFTSCSTTSKLVTTSVTASTQRITSTPIIEAPQVADLDIDISKKISGRAEGKSNTATVDQLKELAMQDALKTVNADVLVEPSFSVTKTSDGYISTIDVEVSGFAGKYKEVRKADKEDVETFKAYLGLNKKEPKSQDSTTVIREYIKVPVNSSQGQDASQAPVSRPTYSINQEVPKTTASNYPLQNNYKKKLGSGIAQTVLAPIFLITGACLIPIGLNNTSGYYDDYGNYYSNGISGAGIAEVTIGAAMLTTGLVMMITGPIAIAKSVKMKRAFMNNGGSISFYPVVTPAAGNSANNTVQMGMGLKMSF